MVAGLAFLSKKGFNPANKSNQKSVWEAKQQKELDDKKAKERADQLLRERDDEELARARGGNTGAAAATLKFMYDPPPGLQGSSNESNVPLPSNDLTQRQPGDDAAAAAFREMLAAATAGISDSQDSGSKSEFAFSNNRGAALQGSTVEATKNKEHMNALEKAVGKKTAQGLTLEEQIERFPQLKNAPMAKGMTETNVHVTFKPLGTQLRNVRCLACGVWGHSRNDRECLVSGWDPFSGGAPPSAYQGSKPEPKETPIESNRDDVATVDKASNRHGKSGKRSKNHKKRRYSSDSDSNSSDSSMACYERRKRRKKHESKRNHKESTRRRRERSLSPQYTQSKRHRNNDSTVHK